MMFYVAKAKLSVSERQVEKTANKIFIETQVSYMKSWGSELNTFLEQPTSSKSVDFYTEQDPKQYLKLEEL